MMMEDGPTKRKLILKDIQAVKIGSADMYCQQIQNARFRKYGYAVRKSMEDMTRCYKDVI
jgi:hypothetical protein